MDNGIEANLNITARPANTHEMELTKLLNFVILLRVYMVNFVLENKVIDIEHTSTTMATMCKTEWTIPDGTK